VWAFKGATIVGPVQRLKLRGNCDQGSNMATTLLEDHVRSSMSFILPTSDFNRRYMAPSQEVNTGVYQEHTVVVRDARPEASKFTLDTSGFTLAKHKSKVCSLEMP
jgi:hypothetical protein